MPKESDIRSQLNKLRAFGSARNSLNPCSLNIERSRNQAAARLPSSLRSTVSTISSIIGEVLFF